MQTLFNKTGTGQKNAVATRMLVCIAALFIIIEGIRMLAPLLTTLLIVAFFMIILSMLYELLTKLRMPPKGAVALLILLIISSTLFVSLAIIPGTVMEFSRSLPDYYRQLTDNADKLTDWLRAQDVEIPLDFIPSMLQVTPADVSALSKRMVFETTGFLKDSMFVIIVLCFAMLELPLMPKTAEVWSRKYPDRWPLVLRFMRDIRHFMGIKTVISAATGLVIYLGLLLLDVKSAGLLGLTAFLLNYIPYIGSVIAAVPGILMALGTGDVMTPIWTSLLYLLTNQLFGNILEPRAMGSGFGVSPVLVLFSVMFWGWVLGPLGMLFAVPFTVAIRSAFFTAPERDSPSQPPSA